MLRFLAIAAVGCMFAGTATGGPFLGRELGVDFRDATWAPADGQHSYTVGTVTATAFGRNLRGAFQDRNLTHGAADGLGIAVGSDGGEVDGREWLRIELAGPTLLTGIAISNLFQIPDGIIGEQGSYSTDGGATWSYFLAPLFEGANYDNDNGELFLPVSIGSATSLLLDFTVFGGLGFLFSEYSLAGFAIDPGPGGAEIPEPASLALLGAGIAALGLVRRRRTAV